jgi:diguanylate cyclase (GGDEF)-like protein
MDFIVILILLATGLLSFIPVVNMVKAGKETKYTCLRYLVVTAFVWTLLLFLERLSFNMVIIYYVHVLTIPIKFMLVGFVVCTILNYIEKPVTKVIYSLFFAILLAELLLVIFHNSYPLFLDITIDQVTDLSHVYEADKGILFLPHLLVSYSALLVGITYMLWVLKDTEIRQYKAITKTIFYSVILVLSLNLSQFLFPSAMIDLTYVSLVIVTYVLYRVIYTKDMIFNLKTSGRGEILSNMREMYILTDSDKHVVEISALLVSNYNVDESLYVGKKLDDLLEYLSKDIVFYSEYDIEQDTLENLDHFHLREKKFTLKGMNDFGYMILLYDQTKVFHLLRELNLLSNYDAMTGLHNRNFMEHKLQDLNGQSNIGILSLDLNGLKANNDYLGHERGDYLLKTLANTMKEIIPQNDQVHMARIGGDEFLIVVLNSSESDVVKKKDALLNACYSDKLLDRISVSIGYAFSEKTCDVYELIQKADDSMYQMKQKTSKAYSKEIVEYAKKTGQYIR